MSFRCNSDERALILPGGWWRWRWGAGLDPGSPPWGVGAGPGQQSLACFKSWGPLGCAVVSFVR